MSKSKFLGEFEIVVLAALTSLGEDAYGIAIINHIEERTDRSVAVGALYATLARLEKKQYVNSSVGEATPQRGGRAKRYYRLTALGQKQLQRSANMLSTMLSDVDGWAPSGRRSC